MDSSNTQHSPGLWALAWRRLRADRVAMLALAVVAAFLLMLLLSAGGLLVADWEDEVAVSYAPPSFVGAAPAELAAAAAAGAPRPANEFDPLADEPAPAARPRRRRWHRRRRLGAAANLALRRGQMGPRRGQENHQGRRDLDRRRPGGGAAGGRPGHLVRRLLRLLRRPGR
nr:hypothetical protein [Rugamonas sp. DEMB1]